MQCTDSGPEERERVQCQCRPQYRLPFTFCLRFAQMSGRHMPRSKLAQQPEPMFLPHPTGSPRESNGMGVVVWNTDPPRAAR